MLGKYCYWSIGTGPYQQELQECIKSARAVGVWTDFHVFCDTEIKLPNVDCYETGKFVAEGGMFILYHLVNAVEKLHYDYFIWLEADTRFIGRPNHILANMHHAPLHVPLYGPLQLNLRSSKLSPTPMEYKALDVARERHGHLGYAASDRFWIISRGAIKQVEDLVREGNNEWHKRGRFDYTLAQGLARAMLFLCSNPDAHTVEQNPDTWADATLGKLSEDKLCWNNPLTKLSRETAPCIVHVGSKHKEYSAS